MEIKLCPICDSKFYYTRLSGVRVCRKCGKTWRAFSTRRKVETEEKKEE
jgi:ribosomal protein L37AE/L43A